MLESVVSVEIKLRTVGYIEKKLQTVGYIKVLQSVGCTDKCFSWLDK